MRIRTKKIGKLPLGKFQFEITWKNEFGFDPDALTKEELHSFPNNVRYKVKNHGWGKVKHRLLVQSDEDIMFFKMKFNYPENRVKIYKLISE